MRHIQSIEFVFENCEVFSMDAQYFGHLHIGDIRRSIDRIACNSIGDMDIAHEFYAEIFSEGDGDYDFSGDTNRFVKFDRILAWDDITSVTVHFDDGTEEDLYLDYDGEEVNDNQTTKLSALGNLYIVVQHGKTVNDIFPDDEINDRDDISFAKKMILREEDSHGSEP